MLKFSGCSCLSSGRMMKGGNGALGPPGGTRTRARRGPPAERPRTPAQVAGCQTHLPSRRPQTGSPLKPLRFRRPGTDPPRRRNGPRRPDPPTRPPRAARKRPHTQGRRARGCADAEADMPSAEASGARCVQRFDDSRNSAIHTTYRISLRSSSIREPRYPLLRVVLGSRRSWHHGHDRHGFRPRGEAQATPRDGTWGVLPRLGASGGKDAPHLTRTGTRGRPPSPRKPPKRRVC